ncbi:hypothetical protein AB1Y20_019521 [Prymnesium parvum]|uniref:Calmodulin-lysine N-methyltransferase n=1 Tax=Prymnesium parvum TaxID=97485 RepID=A0AB34JW34_PRYPA
MAAPDERDVSGAVSWASSCAVDGRMRSWVDLEGHPCVGGHRIGCDVMLWTASLVLLRFLEASALDWRTGREGGPLRVLELSAGAGHLAVGLARLGAHVTATECSETHDRTAWRALHAWIARLARLREGAAQPYAVGVRGGTLRTRMLDWGPGDGLGGAARDEFDVVLLSELVALGEELQGLLVETLGRLLGPRTVAFAIFVDRPFSLNFMWLLSWDASFIVERLEVKDRLGLCEDDEIYLYKITRPSSIPQAWRSETVVPPLA